MISLTIKLLPYTLKYISNIKKKKFLKFQKNQKFNFFYLKNIKKYVFIHMHMTKSIKNKNKNHIYINIKDKKKYKA